MKRNIIFLLFSLVLFIFIGPSELVSRDLDPDGGGAAVRVWKRGFVMDLHENNGVGQTMIFFEVAWLPNGGDGEPDWLYDSDTYYTSGSGYWLCEVYVPAEELTGNGELIWKMWKIQSLPGNVEHGVGPDGWSSAVSRYYDYDYPNDIPPSDFWVYDYRGYDEDRNDILDANEMLLAEKFTPTYILNSASDYVRPEPVQYLGVEKNDLWFYIINMNGGTLYDYPITGQADFEPPISYWNGWVSSSNQNYSWLTFDTWDYIGDPPGSATSANYFLRFHYNYAGNCDSENCWSNNYENERQNNYYPNTLYIHLFKYNQYTIIQYWTFYPYNDFINNHEGDWEHINVWVNSDDPSSASIVKIEYYFHEKYLVRYPGSFQVDDATHPRVYVGGQNTGIAPGVHSGGNYPATKRWEDVTLSYYEWVNGNGPTISYYSFYDSDPQDNYGLVILPDVGDINYDDRPDMSWFKVKIPWGSVFVDSYFGWINQLPFIDDSGDSPPSGPSYRAGWDAVGSHSGRYQLYSD